MYSKSSAQLNQSKKQPIQYDLLRSHHYKDNSRRSFIIIKGN